MTKPNVWRPNGGHPRRDRAVHGPLRSSDPSVWRSRGETRAPLREQPSPRRKKRNYAVEITTAWCKDCGICSAFCPTGALEDGGHEEPHVTEDLCNGCQLCVIRCPDFAVVVTERSSGNGDADVQAGADAPDAGE